MRASLGHSGGEHPYRASRAFKDKGELPDLSEHKPGSDSDRYFVTERYRAYPCGKDFDYKNDKHYRSYHEEIVEEESHVQKHAYGDKKRGAEKSLERQYFAHSVLGKPALTDDQTCKKGAQ